MHKNKDILQACYQLDNKVDNCNETVLSKVQQDHQTLMKTSKLAMKTFTDHVNEENMESTIS